MIRDWREGLGRLETVEPSPGLWERAQAQAAESPVEAVSPIRHRLATIVVAVAVAGAGIAGLFMAFKGHPPSNHVLSGVATYRDPIGNWEISYPARFSRGTLPSAQPRVTFSGTWIANFTPTFDQQTGGPLPTRFPDDGVIVEVYQSFGGPAYLPTEPDSSFPVSLNTLNVIPGSYPGRWQAGYVVANGEPYTVMVRVGGDATQQDRATATDIIESLRFLPLRQGTTIGQQQHVTYYVLAPRDSYSVGSVTRFDASNLPTSSFGKGFLFYLVHVTGGFFAISWNHERCKVTYDAAANQFSCPIGARWALDGSVVAKPRQKFPDDPLKVMIARISLDGHVLVSPNIFMDDTKLDLRLTGHLITGNPRWLVGLRSLGGAGGAWPVCGHV
jgi:hypothetical protein